MTHNTIKLHAMARRPTVKLNQTLSMETFDLTVSYHWARVEFPKMIPHLSVSRKSNKKDQFKGKGCFLV